ncbi:hypothetical protein OESDEN_14819 [Oesophagostomum dentatum]|uniref:Uncharacterized protein n=1 Tax=Oesophagostomum dentatum TaxID=61180 RepID=A0A0B1SKJ8_OESDE|nr:hypothetical protein OESDEN_14819 [Oesophagostomum dentatum]
MKSTKSSAFWPSAKSMENRTRWNTSWTGSKPTWVYDTDMDARLLDDFHYSVVILGPINTPENLQKKSIKEMDLVVQRESKKENVKDGVILELMPYEQVSVAVPSSYTISVPVIPILTYLFIY